MICSCLDSSNSSIVAENHAERIRKQHRPLRISTKEGLYPSVGLFSATSVSYTVTESQTVQVTGFKSRDPKNQGKLIVKTGAVTRRFLGFERIYHVGDDSDMD